jgi:hypothetical protein
VQAEGRAPLVIADVFCPQAFREGGGTAIAVPDEAMFVAQREAATAEGIVPCPESPAADAASVGCVVASDCVLAIDCVVAIDRVVANDCAMPGRPATHVFSWRVPIRPRPPRHARNRERELSSQSATAASVKR